jgi:hypothetical protein
MKLFIIHLRTGDMVVLYILHIFGPLGCGYQCLRDSNDITSILNLIKIRPAIL